VRDTGIGIPADKCEAIFRPFEQADGSTTRKFGGTGLGLTISARLVELMGGQLAVTSKVNEGSVFHFAARFQEESDVAPTEGPGPALRGCRVLLADDNSTSRAVLTEMLAGWHLRPTSVDSGAAALAELERAAARGQAFPIVLLDAVMPAPDGFEVARQLRTRPALAGTIVMLLSSPDRQADVARCRELGISCHLAKPVKPSDLLESMQALLTPGEVTALPKRSKEDEGPQAARPLRVLLAEDNLVNQKLAVRLLEKAGHTVAVTNNGVEALDAIQRHAFDVVLMDVQMPVMGGFEATALLRQRERGTGRHLPVVATTAHAMKGDREQCMAAGMDAYIAKPIQTHELFAVLAELFPVEEKEAAAESPLEPAVEGDRSVWDAEVALANAAGDPDLRRELAELFLDESPRLVVQLAEAAAVRDGANATRLAHALKGSAATVGAFAFRDAAERLEQAGTAAEWAAIDAGLPKLQMELHRLRVTLAEIVPVGA
jgi:CheY-like chemotaxis protein/HPt (histidine-containing phosphotransfer) domain-containing protein